MKKILFIAILLFIGSVKSKGQYRYPNKEDQALAKQLLAKYDEDDKICAISSTEYYSFDTDKPVKEEPPLVTAHVEKESVIIGLKDNCSYKFAEFYDGYSSIMRYRTFYKDGKNFKPTVGFSEALLSDYSYSSDGIFCDDARYKSLSYAFSTLGDEMKFSFIKTYSDSKYLTKIFFNDSYPIEEKTITFDIPDWLNVDIVEFNFEGFNIVKTKNYNAGKKVTTYTYKMLNCNSIKQENNAPIATRNWPHLVLVVKQFEYKGANVKAFNSVDDLYGWYAKLVSKVKNNDKELQAIVTKLTAGKTDDMEKIKSIYYWVQDNIRYIAFESGIAGFQPANADHVFKNKYGDCKGMANLLYAMLKMNGYDARLSWIGTKEIPYDYSLPSLCVNNHMICALMLKDSLYFLDGTESYISLGDYADRIQGRPALIQNGNSYLIKNVPSFNKEHNKIISKRSIQLNGEVLKGSTDITYNGESKTNILRAYNDMASTNRDDALTKFLSKNDKNYTISEIKTSDLKNREVPVNFKYNFELTNNVTTADKEVYVILELDKPYAGISIKEDRKQDFVFHEKVFNTCETEFTVPFGYSVKYIPEIVNEKNENFSLHSEFKQSGNKIIYKRTISFDNGFVKKSEMKQFYAFLKKVKNAYSDQIILAKN